MQRKLETARLKLNKSQHQVEIARVRHLVGLAKGIKVDSKAQELRKFVEGLLRKAPQEKVLIFTEYTDTLDYLRDEVLKGLGPIAQIHGDVRDMEERRQQEEYFQQSDVHLMLATDAAGEGLNLQFCHIMVNYELPWNPNRIEQRIGRLHRYGQEHDVRVYNLQVVNTREGIILARLLHKIQTIERQLGGYAPNILGLTASSAAVNLNRLSDLIMSALTEDAPAEVTAEHVEQALEARREMAERIEQDLFMPLRHFDKGATDKVIERSRELTPSNDDAIESFVRRFFEIHEGAIENTRQKQVLRLRTPRRLLDGKTVLDEYPHAAFSKEIAFKYKAKEVQFIAFGHPLLEAIIRDSRSRTPKLRGAVTLKRVPTEILEASCGVLFNYTLRYSDAQDHTLSEELLPILVTDKGQVDLKRAQRLARVLAKSIDASQHHRQIDEVVAIWDDLESVAEQAAADSAQQYYERVQKEYGRQADACCTA